MPKRARDEGWVGKTVMLTPHAASGKRLPEAAVLKVVGVSSVRVVVLAAANTIEDDDAEKLERFRAIAERSAPSAGSSGA